MATVHKEKLLDTKRLGIDFIAGPDSYKRLPQIIKECRASHKTQGTSHRQKICDVVLSKSETYSDVIPARLPGTNAWVSITRGCDNFCSFCVVPYARGRERSRSVKSILKEAEQCAKENFAQVTLLGQNVNSYRDGKHDFVYLLEEISKIDKIRRIRFMSPHPKDFPQRLFNVLEDNPKLCKHIHLPLQSASDRILKLMNRPYTQSHYLGLIEKIRKASPWASITTDIIVGFPTEKDEDYRQTRSVVKKIGFDSAFIFKYSPRPHTLAARKYPDDVSDTKKTERIVELNHIQKNISLKKNQSYIGSAQEILVEQTSTQKSKKDFQGRTDSNKIVIFSKGKYRVGQFIDLQIVDATANVLKGQII